MGDGLNESQPMTRASLQVIQAWSLSCLVRLRSTHVCLALFCTLGRHEWYLSWT